MAKQTERWAQNVNTVSTFPPAGTFSKDAQSIARIMARPKVSPKGLGSAIRMIQFYIIRAGKDLSESHKEELEKAKQILRERLLRQKHALKKKNRLASKKRRAPK